MCESVKRVSVILHVAVVGDLAAVDPPGKSEHGLIYLHKLTVSKLHASFRLVCKNLTVLPRYLDLGSNIFTASETQQKKDQTLKR